MKVRIDMTRLESGVGERWEVGPPTLAFITDTDTWFLDSDGFDERALNRISKRDRALLEAFVLLAADKLGIMVEREE